MIGKIKVIPQSVITYIRELAVWDYIRELPVWNMWYNEWVSRETMKKYAKKCYVALKWFLEIAALTFFWLVVLPSCLESDFFMEAEWTELIRDVALSCAKPSLRALTRRLIIIIFLNLLFNFLIRRRRMSRRCYHITSIILGLCMLQMNTYSRNMWIICTILMVYFCIFKALQYKFFYQDSFIKPIYTVSFIAIGIAIVGEFIYPNHENWLESRGPVMIMTMKLISVAREEAYVTQIPNTEFFGYMLCPPTVLFGPWIAFEDYRMHRVLRSALNWKYPIKLIQILTYAMINMLLANCLHQMLLIPPGRTPFHYAFRNAWAFRSSNYFICYMAELSMLCAGFSKCINHPQGRWMYPCCRPSKIEIPRSMALVVSNWNIPVHNFLKLNIYMEFLYVGKVYAVLFTFLFSSMLHGLNVRITVILLTLGVISLCQEAVHKALSTLTNSCTKIKPCKDCDHKYKWYHPCTMLFHLWNIIWNIFHLGYLGCIMDESMASSGIKDIFLKWDDEFSMTTHNYMLVYLATASFVGDR